MLQYSGKYKNNFEGLWKKLASVQCSLLRSLARETQLHTFQNMCNCVAKLLSLKCLQKSLLMPLQQSFLFSLPLSCWHYWDLLPSLILKVIKSKTIGSVVVMCGKNGRHSEMAAKAPPPNPRHE